MRNRYLTFAACFIAIILGISAFYILTQKKEQPVESADRLSICTSIYPIYDFTKNICGESADVFCIVPDGVDFRTWQPSENDISAICSSDIFIYSGKGAEPWLERILPAVSKTSVKLLNTSQNVS